MPSSPILKATLSAAALSSISNVLAQLLEAYRDSKPFVFDGAPFFRFVVLALVTSPPNYLWQQLLERSFPAYERKRAPARDAENQLKDKEEVGLGREAGAPELKPRLNIRNTLTKWFIDCITVGAVMNTVAFFVLMGVLKQQTVAQIGHNVRTQTIPLIVTGYKIWPFASIISFSCVPVERRIVFLSFVGLIWGIYMSLVAARV